MKPQISIITGSTLGNAEYVAEHIEQVLQRHGYPTHLKHGPTLQDIPNKTLWLIITSTHGAGELPDNLRPLFTQICHEKINLSSLHFAVIGLGNSDYDTFCYAVDRVEKILLTQHATQICPSLKIDVINVDDCEQYAEQWLPTFIQSL